MFSAIGFDFSGRVWPGALILLFMTLGLRAQNVPPGFSVQHLTPNQGLSLPTDFAFLPDGRILATEKESGDLVLFALEVSPTPVTVGSLMALETFGERGLLSLAPDPDFAINGWVYLQSTRTVGGATKLTLSRVTLAGDLNDALSTSLGFVPGSELNLLEIDDASTIHKGGSLRFGPDGALYMSIGDDNVASLAQFPLSARGAILRLDVSGVGTLPPAGPADLMPADNPGAGAIAPLQRLVIAHGLRNPFTMTVDDQTGDLFIGDVGTSVREEIDQYEYPTSGTLPILNYGWPFLVGDQDGPALDAGLLLPPGLTAPIDQRIYGTEGAVIIVGTLYRDNGAPDGLGALYDGRLLHADWGTGTLIWVERNATTGVWERSAPAPGQVSPDFWGSGFGGVLRYRTGADGAVWFLDYNVGRIGRIKADVAPPTMTLFDGGDQVGLKGEAFAFPCRFEVFDGQGAMMPGAAVTAQVSGNGSLSAPGPFLTDGQGRVSIPVEAVGAGPISVVATSAGGATASASLFARGLEVTSIPAGGSDVLVCEFINTSFGTADVPFLFGVAGPSAPPLTTAFGTLFLDVFGFTDTIIIEDGLNIIGGVQIQGATGDPSRTNVYVVPAGVLNSSLVFQCIWVDGTTPTSIFGQIPSTIVISNPVSLP